MTTALELVDKLLHSLTPFTHSYESKCDSDEWILYYWGITGRGHFIRILFEEAGVTYKEINDSKQIYEKVYCKGCNENKHFGVFAPPVLQHGNLILGQTNSIVRYVATKLNLLPKNEIDKFHSDQIMGNLQDILTEFFKISKQSIENKLKFCNGRFNLWMSLLSNNLGNNEYYFDNKCTYADLQVYLLLSWIKLILNTKYNQFVTNKYKNLEDLRLRIEKRKGTQNLAKKNIKTFGNPWKWE